MNLSEHQIHQFNQLREELLSKINLFKISIDFPANYEQLGRAFQRPWLKELEEAINSLKLEEKQSNEKIKEIAGVPIDSLSAMQCGAILTVRYFQPIEEIFIKEFKVLPKPFDVLIPEYEDNVIKIFDTEKN